MIRSGTTTREENRHNDSSGQGASVQLADSPHASALTFGGFRMGWASTTIAIRLSASKALEVPGARAISDVSATAGD